jgi:hypothetical protein
VHAEVAKSTQPLIPRREIIVMVWAHDVQMGDQASFLLGGLISSDGVYSFARGVSAPARLKSVHAVVIMPGKHSAW